MKHLPFRLLCVVALSAAALLFPCVHARADLPAEITTILNDKPLKRAVVGVEVIKLGEQPGTDQVVFRSNAQTPLIPASNLKLLTTSAALHKFGPEFKFRTQLLAAIDGDVALIGAGDPTFGDAEFLKDVGWNITTVFENWADQLAKRNIASVRDVILDDSIFDEVFLHPNWPEDQIQRRYVAEVGGFNLNANVLDFTVRPTAPGQVATYVTNPPDTRYANVRNSCVTGSRNAIWLSRFINTNDIVLKGETPSRSNVPVSVTIHDPSMYAATVFAETLARKGIVVTGTVRRDRTLSATRRAGGTPDRWRVLAIHETPLTTVLNRANKDSVNLYAESLCKRLGFETTGQPGSWANGTAALGGFLRSIGVGESEFRLDDGSGLSKQNAISAEAMARILTHNFHAPVRDVFLKSLAVAGVDGTLDRRFRGSDLRGRVFAKSGFVNGVCSLSGYLKTRDEQWYAFSILMNKAASLGDMQQIQERIVKAVDSNAATFADGR